MKNSLKFGGATFIEGGTHLSLLVTRYVPAASVMSLVAGCDGFPNLANNSTVSAICIVADPNLYYQNKLLLTSSGYGFDAHIQVGIDNPAESGSGCFCIERDSYKCFGEFYHSVIVASQGGRESPTSISSQRMKLLDLQHYRHSIDSEYIKDVLVQTRRNISGFRFSPKCSRAERRKLFSIVESALAEMYPNGPYLTRIDEISLEQKRKLQANENFLEKPHAQSMCSRSGGVREWPDGRGILFIPESAITLWVNEEDHLRIFSRPAGQLTNIVDVLEKVSNCEVLLEGALSLGGDWCYMHDPHFGYLTTDPTKLGVLDVRLTMEIAAMSSSDTLYLLAQLCNRFQVNFHPKPESSSLPRGGRDKKGLEFNLSTRPNVFTPEDQRIGQLLECIKSIILLDKQIVRHGDAAGHCMVAEVLSSPIQCHLLKAPCKDVPFLTSVMSPLGWIKRESRCWGDPIDESLISISPTHVPISEEKRARSRSWSLCCSPDAADVLMDVSDPLIVQQSDGMSLGMSRRRVGEEELREDSLSHLTSGVAQPTQPRDISAVMRSLSPVKDDSGGVEGAGGRSSQTIPNPISASKSDFLHGVTDFPFFPRGCVSLLCKYLTWNFYERKEHVRTSISGCSLSDLILPGTENSDLPIGILAADAECYEAFSELFDPIIRSLHDFTPGVTQQLRDSQSGKLRGISGTTMTYCSGAKVQTSRNVMGYPLAMCISRSDRRLVEALLVGILDRLMGPLTGKYYALDELTSDQIKQLHARNIRVDRPGSDTALSIAGCNRDWPDGRGIFISDSLEFVALVNHSDHLLAIACEQDSADMISVFERWSVAMMLIEGLLNSIPLGSSSPALTHTQGEESEEEVRGGSATVTATTATATTTASAMGGFQCSDRLGYIACSPQDLGTGSYASITIRIPQLGTTQDSLHVICDRLGVRAVSVQPAEDSLCAAYGDANTNIDTDTDAEQMRYRDRQWEWVDRSQTGSDNDQHYLGGAQRKSKTGIGGRDAGASDRRWRSRPPSATTYEIKNKRCMGKSEVQLAQEVIDGVTALIRIEIKVKNGNSIDDLLSKPHILTSPTLSTHPLRASQHDML